MPSVYTRPDSPYYWCKFRGWDKRWVQKSTLIRIAPGTDRERLAHSIALDWETEHALVRAGKLDPADLEIREKGQTAIDLVRDRFLGSLESDAWRGKCRGVLAAFLAHGGMRCAAELGSPMIIGRIERFLRAQARSSPPRSAEWIKNKRGIIIEFGEWCWRNGFIRENQAKKTDSDFGGNAERSIVHRAFTAREADALAGENESGLFSAQQSPSLPEERRLFYAVRLETGLRGAEAMRLRRDDLNLAGSEPAIRARKEIAHKNSVGAVLPITRPLAARLAAAFMMLHPQRLLFTEIMPRRRETRAQILQRDLKTLALDAGLNERSFRMTHTTWLTAAGVDDKIIGTLRRDKGAATELLRRWNYTDLLQVMPVLREAIAKMDAHRRGQLRATSAEVAHA